jgi:hypothetical protein
MMEERKTGRDRLQRVEGGEKDKLGRQYSDSGGK